MIDGEVVSGDEYEYRYWMGNWGSAALEESIICKNGL